MALEVGTKVVHRQMREYVGVIARVFDDVVVCGKKSKLYSVKWDTSRMHKYAGVPYMWKDEGGNCTRQGYSRSDLEIAA